MARILIIDDDQPTRDMLRLAVTRYGHEAETAQSLKVARILSRKNPYDVVFLDVMLKDGNGLDYLQEFKAGPGDPEVIILTGFSSPDGAEMAIRSGAWDYVTKGSSLKALLLPMMRALDYRKEKKAGVGLLVLHSGQIVGSSPVMKTALDQVAKAAQGEAGVLLTGETGTGKELFARTIHENSLRSGKPFVVVDCSALPEALVESILFGHRKGSFTGAVETRDGLVKLAHQGTLFLDEIGELPLMIQKSFLRVLQEKRYRPVGASTEESSDFRVIAATNRDLERMGQEHTFREDLLYRLSAFKIHLPPLRDRGEDLLELARQILDRRWKEADMQPKPLSDAFLEAVSAYAWPGNIRELIHAIDWVVGESSHADSLQPHHLPVEIRGRIAREAVQVSPAPAMAEAHSLDELPTLDVYRNRHSAQIEQAYLEELLRLHGAHMKEACRVAGLSRSRLYALLQKYGISRK